MDTETARALARVSDADIDTYERDGAHCLRQVFEPKWLDLIARGIERDLRDPGPYGRVQSPPDDPGFFYTDYYMWRRIPELRRFALESPAGAVAARLMRSERVGFFFDGLFVKEPGTLKESAWHQDQVYYNVDGDQALVMWIPIDPVDEETCLQTVRGAHRWPQRFERRMLNDSRDISFGENGGDYVPVPDIESRREDYEIMSFDMEPGDVIAFHPMMLHGARGNPSPTRRRRALQATWLGDDAVYGERPGDVEPHITGHVFEPGDCLIDVESVFPPVWPRA